MKNAQITFEGLFSYYKKFIDNVSDLVCIVNRDNNYKFNVINEQAFFNELGYSRNDVILESFLNILHPDDTSKFVELLKVRTNNADILKEIKIKHKEGTDIKADIKVKQLNQSSSSNFLIVLKIISETIKYESQFAETTKKLGMFKDEVQDLKDQELVMPKLKKSDILLNSVIRSMSDGILVVDNGGKVILSNQRFAEMWRIPESLVQSRDNQKLLDFVISSLKQPKAFLSQVQELYNSPKEAFDTLEFKDGRMFEYYTFPLKFKDKIRGRVLNFRNITQKRKRERKLKESEEMYRLISENAYDLISIINRRFKFEYINEKPHMKFLGYTKEDLLGKSVARLIHPEDLNKYAKQLKARMEIGEGSPELRVKHKDGRWVWINFRGSILNDTIPSERKYLIIARDISKQKESEQKYESLFDNTIEGIAIHEIIYNSEGKPINYKILDVNPRFEQILSIKAENVLNKSATEAYGVDSPPYLDIYSKVAKTMEPNTFETYFEPMDQHFEISVFALERGKFATVFEDITTRKEIEKQLKESQRMMETLLSNLPGMVYRCRNDEEWTMEYISEGCFELTGYYPEEMLLNKITSYGRLIHEDDRITVRDTIQDAISEKTSFNLIYRINTKYNIEKWVWEQGCGVFDQNGKLVSIEGFISDYTQQKQVEILREEFNEKLKREVENKTKELNELLNKQKDYIDMILKSSQFKTNFMATMSHELRTPLNVVIGFTDLLIEGTYGQLNKDQLKFIKNIQTSAIHLLTLINEILDVSKIEAGKVFLTIETFNLNRVLNQIHSTIKPLYEEKGLVFKINGVNPDTEISADRIRLNEILYNLLSNAIKYTIKGKITIDFSETNNFWQFDVKDTGIGIAKKDHDMIFEDFTRVKSKFVESIEGTGLGLSLTKRLVDLHKGEIWVKSMLGKGAVFSFTIPKNSEEI